MSEERNIRIEDDKGNAYYPHAKAKTTFTENGETIDKYIPDSSLHTVITVDIDDYISFIMSGRLSDLKVTIPRSGWFVMNVTRGGVPFACEWRNLPTYDLLYIYNNVTVNNKLLPEASVFSFEKGSGICRKMEYENNKEIIVGTFLKKIGETYTVKLGKKPRRLKLSCFLLNSKSTVEGNFIQIDGETAASDSINGAYAFIIRNSDGKLDTLFAVWSHIGMKITSEGFEFGVNGYDFDFIPNGNYKVYYEAVL